MLGQSLTENLLLTTAGGALGLLFAKAGVVLVLAYLPTPLPRVELVAVNGTSVVYAAAMSAVIGLLIGLVSVRQLRADPGDALKSLSRGASGGPRVRVIRTVLIVVEVALSFALLIGAGLLTRSVHRLSGVDPGFDSNGLMVAGVSMPLSRYSDRQDIKAFLDRAQAGLDSERRLNSHSVVSIPPVSGTVASAPFNRKDRSSLPQDRRFANYRFVGGNYFRTMRIPIIAGREFFARDDEKSLAVAIVSDQFVRRYLPDIEPLGAHLLVSDNDAGPREVEIVGIVGNVKQFGLDDAPSADLYIPVLQVPNERNGFLTRGFTFVLRYSSDRASVAALVKTHLMAAEPDAALTLRTLDEVMASSLTVRQFQMSLMSLFAVFATFLAGLGLYGVMSYLTAQRRREIGVRLALGATGAGVTRLIVRQGLAYAAVGMIAGTAVVVAGYGLIANKLYLTGPFDWAVSFSATGLVFFVAALASWLPALRASRIDPIVVLRSE